MKQGKVSQAVLDRSVIRPLTMAGVRGAHAGFGSDCAVIPDLSEASGEKTAIAAAASCGQLGGRTDFSAEMIIAGAVNNLRTAGAEAEQLLLSVMFPEDRGTEDAQEQMLKNLMKQIGEICRRFCLTVEGGHTQVCSGIHKPVLSVTALGCVSDSVMPFKPGMDLVMTGTAGMAGAALLAERFETELRRRYPFSIMDGAREAAGELRIREAARAVNHFGTAAMHDISQGGVFAALWELAEHAQIGLEVDLKRIPVRQETIEICEFFDLNPYQLYGQGGLLIGTDSGEALEMYLHSRGIRAAVIGRTTDGRERRIINGEDIRYLDRPGQDMLWQISLPEERKNSYCANCDQ